jgi:hypothetical protein
MTKITSQELKEWRVLQKQFENGYHLSESDWRELVRLNHLLLEITGNIHNKSMELL